MTPSPLGSVVIPAHNEAAVIGRCLDAILTGFEPGELEVVVACNGCTDGTEDIVRGYGSTVRLVEVEQASKPAALRAADSVSAVFPRLYVDADVVLPGKSARLVIERLSSELAVAARPPIRYQAASSAFPVRCYYRARARVPEVMNSLWGAGMYGLSAAGRARFDAFPDIVADDLYVDAHFTRDEIDIVEAEPVVVTVPRRTSHLFRILRRAYQGNAENRARQEGAPQAPRSAPQTAGSTLRGVLATSVEGPGAAVDAAVYIAIAIVARVSLRLSPQPDGNATRAREMSRVVSTTSVDLPLLDSSVNVRPVTAPSHAVRLLQLFAATVMILPADYVVKAVGAAGYPAALVSYLMLLVWLSGTIFGQHNPLAYRYQVRFAVTVLFLVSLASYLNMDRGFMSAIQLASADRWLMQLAGVLGVIVIAAECLESLDDVKRVLRVLVWGGAFCGVVALLQFKGGIDLTRYLKLPGFQLNSALATNTGIGSRGGGNRVAGTSTDPIELGVVAGMLLPLAVYLLMHDHEKPQWQRWAALICTAFCVPASVSRSGVIAVVASFTVLLISLPPVRRLKGMAAIPPALAAVFVGSHGLIGTLVSYFLAGSSDPSVTHRTNNYPYVLQLVSGAPLLGHGGGTYIPASAVNILDNEYLTTAIQLGLVGVLALLFYLVWPMVAVLVAFSRTTDPELRDLCAALAGAELAAILCSATFDSLSFPMFVYTQALVVGISGTAWLLVQRQRGEPFTGSGGPR